METKVALILGAGRGIGFAMAEVLRERGFSVHGTYRDEQRAQELFELNDVSRYRVDPLNENELGSLATSLKEVRFDLIINCIGILEYKSSPEKGLRSLNLETMEEVFKVNTFITPLVAKHFYRHLKEDSVLCSLSAMVGSIEDNRIGGWYSYRASKTALNMFMKTIAIEFARRKMKTKVLSIHPGTTKTGLSQNFLKGVSHKVWEARGSAENIIRNVIENADEYESGAFVNWDGATIPW